MVTDEVENLGSYPQLKGYQKGIEEFIKALDMRELGEGRYVLRKDALITLIQKYHTKDKDSSRMRSHKRYADLQYIHREEEMIYMDHVEELVLAKGRTPEEDILFYEPRRDSGADVLKSGMFGYYEPQDVHMPYITYLNSCDVVKVVFKTKTV